MQKKLDVLSNEVMLQENEWTGHLAGMASEEMEDVYTLPTQCKRGKYLLVFDPLDGSSNIDVNLTVGSIFSILRAPEGAARVGEGVLAAAARGSDRDEGGIADIQRSA